MFTDETHEVYSKLSGLKTVDGMSVHVQIFRLSFYPLWALEVVTDCGTSLVWDELFATEQEALAAFEVAVEEQGLASLLRNAHLEITQRLMPSIPFVRPDTPNAKGFARLGEQRDAPPEHSGSQFSWPHYERA